MNDEIFPWRVVCLDDGEEVESIVHCRDEFDALKGVIKIDHNPKTSEDTLPKKRGRKG